MSENGYLEKDEIKKRLTEQMFQHRDTLGFKQKDIARLLDKPEKTYQRWESTGDGLSNIFDILNIFRVLRFSIVEIINVLGLPPLMTNEIKEIYQDEETLKNIREDGICSFIRQKCGGMESITIDILIDILMKEHLKRRGYDK